MNYKNWKENNLAPAKLTLDKLNPRLWAEKDYPAHYILTFLRI